MRRGPAYLLALSVALLLPGGDEAAIAAQKANASSLLGSDRGAALSAMQLHDHMKEDQKKGEGYRQSNVKLHEHMKVGQQADSSNIEKVVGGREDKNREAVDPLTADQSSGFQQQIEAERRMKQKEPGAISNLFGINSIVPSIEASLVPVGLATQDPASGQGPFQADGTMDDGTPDWTGSAQQQPGTGKAGGQFLPGNGMLPLTQTEMAERLRMQDAVVLCLLLVVYAVTLCFGWSMTYRMAATNNRVRYYSERSTFPLLCEDNDMGRFLRVFNSKPIIPGLRLQVDGWDEDPDSIFATLFEEPLLIFSFCLDLDPFICEQGSLNDEDRRKLQNFLGNGNANPLAYLEVHKEIRWDRMELLKEAVKKRIQSLGFNGFVDVRVVGDEELTILQNNQWANFVRSRSTVTLVALSFVAIIPYALYMLFRSRPVKITSAFRVSSSVEAYWSLVGPGLTADGFNPSFCAPGSASSRCLPSLLEAAGRDEKMQAADKQPPVTLRTGSTLAESGRSAGKKGEKESANPVTSQSSDEKEEADGDSGSGSDVPPPPPVPRDGWPSAAAGRAGPIPVPLLRARALMTGLSQSSAEESCDLSQTSNSNINMGA
uniref:Transmembrane protein n=1 Tax=Chromera velia CCMP2878 TaxID=1169474 RepID=A0A0G4HDY5_9ALVE|eukprot:Cvel_26530.t1-p1 / transcript=Cvel_26530.t1 / gene=Cvel_26530 / organism=Chromera_velia_CCMP2878 / gene_product=hypothetical protein / transcript_product=hypothetical protein / location=Cvel_scaffold3171:6746-11298(+) / protein_length=601 / sequence_SO=supercontig / SO=protein_coding / is_pseudo=false